MNGILLRQHDEGLEREAARRGLMVAIAERLPYERTLVVGPGARVPWKMLEFGWRLLDRWEAVAPLGPKGMLAANVGGENERERTRAVIGDLRVPVYAELLFVRDCEGGRALMEAIGREGMHAGEPRLAFLRALYATKPLFLALPRTWLTETGQEAEVPQVAASRPAKGLVSVQVGPGRYIRCRPGEEEQVKQRYALERMSRRERREVAAVAK